jgi:hypothetical protein
MCLDDSGAPWCQWRGHQRGQKEMRRTTCIRSESGCVSLASVLPCWSVTSRCRFTESDYVLGLAKRA